MYYYQHNIGDFDKATRHLTRIERSVYRDLIELYYDTEHQLNLDIGYLCRKILAKSNEEVTAVEQVLSEFFTKTPDGWYHDRCEEEIEKYHNHISQRSEAGKKSAAARKQKRQRALNGSPAKSERNSNDKATNQEPITVKQETNIIVDSGESPVEQKDFVNEQFNRLWKHYPVKKSKVKSKSAFNSLVKGKKESQVRFWVDLILFYHTACIERGDIGADKLHASTLINQKRWEDDPEFFNNFKRDWINENNGTPV